MDLLDRDGHIHQYANYLSLERTNLWINKEAVKKIIRENPASREDIDAMILVTLESIDLVLQEGKADYSTILINGDTLLMEPNITPSEKSLVEENLAFLEKWREWGGFIPLTQTIH